VYQDGSIALNHGGTEMGQGLFQKVAQVTASVFGVDASVVKITATDTGKVPNTSATAASSGADLNGMAAKAAAETIKGRLAEFIADKHQAKASSVRFVDGTVRVAGEVYGFAQVVAWAYQARVSLSSTGFYATPKIVWDRVRGVGRPFFYFAYGAAVTEVVIDRLTGENRILRADVLHDTGTSLNPALDIGQVEGAYVQGAGWLTTEELVWDGKGRLSTHAPSTYKIPACSDRPDLFNVALWGKPNREDAVGKSKAVGEPPFMLGISALMALSDAVAACGDGSVYPALDAPATAERVLAGAGDCSTWAGGPGGDRGVRRVLSSGSWGVDAGLGGYLSRGRAIGHDWRWSFGICGGGGGAGFAGGGPSLPLRGGGLGKRGPCKGGPDRAWPDPWAMLRRCGHSLDGGP